MSGLITLTATRPSYQRVWVVPFWNTPLMYTKQRSMYTFLGYVDKHISIRLVSTCLWSQFKRTRLYCQADLPFGALPINETP